MALVLASTDVGSSGELQLRENIDFRSRFEQFQALDSGRDSFINDILNKLDAVTAELNDVSTNQLAVLRADLENEKVSRRALQADQRLLRDKLSNMEKARFVSVLVDADADIYHFADEFLSCGLQGGQGAADKFMEKIKEYLVSLGSLKDAKDIPVLVKAYANLAGLQQRFIKERKVTGPAEVTQFWIGFTQRYPTVDFVDVGPGKELADNKIREVLRLNINNPQCEHILLACGHDGGYVPVLSPYAGQESISKRITLISGGPGSVNPTMEALKLRSTEIFERLFTPSSSPQAEARVANWSAVAKTSASQPVPTSPQPVMVDNWRRASPPVAHSDEFTAKTSKNSGVKSLSVAAPKIDYNVSHHVHPSETLVENSHRLGPVKRDPWGNRVDKDITVSKADVAAIRSRKLCQWHYLRSDCTNPKCPREHWDYPRPLSAADYNALWFLSRKGKCHRFEKEGDCDDDHCIYGHWTD